MAQNQNSRIAGIVAIPSAKSRSRSHFSKRIANPDPNPKKGSRSGFCDLWSRSDPTLAITHDGHIRTTKFKDYIRKESGFKNMEGNFRLIRINIAIAVDSQWEHFESLPFPERFRLKSRYIETMEGKSREGFLDKSSGPMKCNRCFFSQIIRFRLLFRVKNRRCWVC